MKYYVFISLGDGDSIFLYDGGSDKISKHYQIVATRLMTKLRGTGYICFANADSTGKISYREGEVGK